MAGSSEWMRRYLGPWWLLGLLGLSSLVLGVLALVWPGRTILVLVVLLGLHLLIYGTIRIAWALADDLLPQRGFVALTGILGILAGLIVLRQPFRTVAILVVFLGLYWVFSGLVDIFNALADDGGSNRAMLLILAALSVGAGVIVLLWPAITLLAVAIVTGVHLVIGGLGQLMVANELRKAEGDAGAMAAGAAPA